jgi:hypothetical protein
MGLLGLAFGRHVAPSRGYDARLGLCVGEENP